MSTLKQGIDISKWQGVPDWDGAHTHFTDVDFDHLQQKEES